MVEDMWKRIPKNGIHDDLARNDIPEFREWSLWNLRWCKEKPIASDHAKQM